MMYSVCIHDFNKNVLLCIYYVLLCIYYVFIDDDDNDDEQQCFTLVSSERELHLDVCAPSAPLCELWLFGKDSGAGVEWRIDVSDVNTRLGS